MAYTKQTWENLPSTNTPITSDRLNHIEDGIYNAYEINNSYSTSETKGYSCSYINSNIQDVYSTTETLTNKIWTDNKPIYRKVIETTNAQCTTTGTLVDKNVSVSSLNIDTMTDLRLKLDVSDNFVGFDFVFGGNDATNGTRCYYDIANDNIVIRNGNTGYNVANITLILEYTKSS